MRVENLLLNNFILNNREEIFDEGYTFNGKVLELMDDLVFIEVKGQGTIEAKLETNVKMAIGEEVSFIVKSVDDNEIILKPLIRNKVQNPQLSDPKKNDSISNLLKSINIKETKLSMDLAESLMKYNALVTEENLMGGIRILEKLFQLSNLKEEEKVIFIENQPPTEKDLMQNEIENIPKKFSVNIDSKISKEAIVKEDILENNISLDKVDIKSLLVVHKNEDNNSKDITQLVKEFLGNENAADMEEQNIKIISFLLKNDIKSSLNNIKNLRDLNEKPIEFVNDFKLIDKILNKDKSNDIHIDEGHLEEDEIKSIFSSKDNKLAEIQKSIREFGNTTDLKMKEDIRNLNNKIDFLREINKDLSFVFFPIKHMEKDLNGVLTLIKEDKKKRNYNGRTNIYINVETYNLGNIKVSCQLISDILHVKMNIRNEDLELFKSTEKQLIEKISLIGYSLDRIEFILDNDIQIIDTIVSNPNPTYILDLKA
ncbi:hypothetical protein [Tissierella praeacuta]|uniref:hypothetical protein n=1 Tax=Tissierella praeacuta TaxID=43131 RepID=UPI00333F227F